MEVLVPIAKGWRRARPFTRYGRWKGEEPLLGLLCVAGKGRGRMLRPATGADWHCFFPTAQSESWNAFQWPRGL